MGQVKRDGFCLLRPFVRWGVGCWQLDGAVSAWGGVRLVLFSCLGVAVLVGLLFGCCAYRLTQGSMEPVSCFRRFDECGTGMGVTESWVV
ncbi:hypothetical protein Dimus_019179 [Dionaea muscipula]